MFFRRGSPRGCLLTLIFIWRRIFPIQSRYKHYPFPPRNPEFWILAEADEYTVEGSACGGEAGGVQAVFDLPAGKGLAGALL